MESRAILDLNLLAVVLTVVYTILVCVGESVSTDHNSEKIRSKNEALESYHPSSTKLYISMMLKNSLVKLRFRRQVNTEFIRLLPQDYEERLFESLNIIGSVPATRLYVPEYILDDKQAFNIEIGTVVGKVRKLFPHGKQLIVWPYPGWRNFTVDENTGEVRTTAKLDFERHRLYNMTIRDFKYNYSYPDPLRVPPEPSPAAPAAERQKYYVDHYLIVEIVDRNDHSPQFVRETSGPTGVFNGIVNTNALAGTPILYIRATDDDSGPRGRIRFNIITDGNGQSPFTIDPNTYLLKTTGEEIRAGEIVVKVEALDYGMPPKTSGFHNFRVIAGKLAPLFLGNPYNLNFSEASVPGSKIGEVKAISRSGISLKYEIVEPDEVIKKTFAINHLGEITLLRKLDFDNGNSTEKCFTFTVRVTEDIYQGRSNDENVNLKLVNADDHLGMFKTPAIVLEFKEGTLGTRGDVYKVDIEDCDCRDNCQCKSNEMIYSIGDTDGYFAITNGGQIRNIKQLDYDKKNYFFFPVHVTDPGTNGRTRTSYFEINVLDVDDTPPIFRTSIYDFSIFEDAPKNQVVGVAQAEDPDPTTKPDEVSYRITIAIPDEGREYFYVGNQGVIKVLKNNNQFRGSDKYELTIVASDSGDKDSDPPATVTIHVIDVNDHQPTFTNCKSYTMPENEPIGTILTTLSATDEDRGVNKLMEYSLEKLQTNYFTINNETGVISTIKKLDRETNDEIFVVAKATDGGTDRSEPLRQIGYCQFIVKLTDVNDHHPEFTVQEFDVSVLRNLSVGGRVLYVEAIDPDEGDNAKIAYTIISQKIAGRNVEYLEVVESSGEVKVKNRMTGLNNFDQIVLTIEASNKVTRVVGSTIGKSSQTTVKVSFANTAPPQFTKPKFIGFVRENVDPGSTVMILSRTGSNTGGYSLQTYRDRDALPFHIDSSTGAIKTSKILNYETDKKYIFAVQVGSQDVSSAIVQINVEDIDDVVPIFGNDYFETTISEGAGPEANVFRVQATDPDPQNRGKIIYSIEKKHDYQYFQVVPETGYAQIKTAKRLKAGFFDRERKESYSIIVEAHRENSDKLRSTALLIINVRDENDSPPIFEQTSYIAKAIPENVHVPYTVKDTRGKILRVIATDKDIFENAEVYYFITSGNDGRFEMRTVFEQDTRSYGELIVTRPLDAKKTREFERNPVYNLTVTATDRKHTAVAHISIRILDRPDTKPEFLQVYYEKSLPENAGLGLNVVQVQVKKPEDPKAVILFQLDEKAEPYFAINENTGLITTAGGLLDWEKTPVITFPVYAYERLSPNITGQTIVRVKVNDVNDASPLFPDQPYIGYIKENSAPGTLVRYINAIDLDNPDINDGKNVKLTYQLMTNTGEDPFDMDSKLFDLTSGGRLVTKVSLDAEEFRRNLTIRVRAWDDGRPRLYGETDVTIVILDENEFPVWFRKEKYEATVSETQPPGFVVLQLTTKDQDFSPRNNYAFSLKSGNDPYAFDINQETGEIVVAGVLDVDITGKKVYTLAVGVKARSNQLLQDRSFLEDPIEHSAEVTITVTEANDNRPTFTETDKTYEATIPENTPVGTLLDSPIIEARDADLGYTSSFRYFIQSGNEGDWFAVEKISKGSNVAKIKIQHPLDREFRSRYEMQMVAIDDGGVSDLAWLRITLTDVNDNPPRFLSSYYTATIQEGRCDPNKVLATLTVVDDDLPEQGPFSLEFTPNGNPSNRFKLDQTSDPPRNSSKLYCTGTINRETTADLVVTVKATDNPVPRLSSTANVFIHVTDVDEFRATSASMRIIVNAFKGKFIGGPIGQTYFRDKDGDSWNGLTYSLTGSDKFTVKQDDGWISAKSTVQVGNYELKIQGKRGTSRPSCTVDVTVRNIPEEAVENSAAIQFHEVVDPNRFLNPIRESNTNNYKTRTYYDEFVEYLAQLFDVSSSNVFVFSVQVSKNIKPGRSQPAIDIHFAIKKISSAKSDFLPRYILINILEKNKGTLKNIGFKLGMIGLDYCAHETLEDGMCRNIVVADEQYSVVSSDYGLLPVPGYAVSLVSVKVTADDEYDRYAPDPDPEYDKCVPGGPHCLNGGTCHDVVPRGFVCECPGAYSGPQCQLTTRTFKGNSYIWLPPKTPHSFGSVSLEFATSQASGVLLYQGQAVKGGNNGHKDFLAISLKDGFILVGLSFGGEKPIAVHMNKGPKLNDRKWHHVEVSHQRKEVTIIIDHCRYADIVEDDERIVEIRTICELITRTTENFQFLNGLGPMQIGGIENIPLEYIDSKYIVYRYFDGCIRKIKENLEMYDLAYPLKVVNAPAGCTIMAPCPDCKNGGYCFPGFTHSVCACPAGFVGDDCSGNAPRFSYMANSFTEYTLPGEERRRKRAAVNEASDLLDRYTSHITMQIRLDPAVRHAIFFYAVSEDGLEYSILAYEEQKLYYELKLLDALVRLEMDPKVHVADGNWHNVVMRREGNTAVLQVDYAGRVSKNTGGKKQLIRMSSGKIVVGGLPNIAPNQTIANKVVEAAVTDVRYRRRRSAGAMLGVTTEDQGVSSIRGDMQGCTGSINYNGRNLDIDPNVKKERLNVKFGCPCRVILQCRNGGSCVDAAVPFCQCTHGWSGRTCEEVVYVPTVPSVQATRIDGRARRHDGGILIVIVCVIIIINYYY